MAQNLAQGSITKLYRIAIIGVARNKPHVVPSMKTGNYSISTQQGSETVKDSDTVKSVFISQSNDIFTNLALEDWLYKNFDFTNHQILLLWQNSPAVVIGRHQNPWLEANTAVLSEHGIEVARRNSGGGTVYHDNGNLNLTFFTPREHYNRKNNLQLISRALFREWGLKTEISPREDIVSGGYKISGTAAKLGRPNAYHHCTLLVDVDKEKLKHALHKHNKGIKTNATQSIPSPVMNLLDMNSHVKLEKLLSAIGWEYLRTCPYTAEDKGKDFIMKQRGFQFINPTDQWFPGLEKLRAEFSSWDWRFGKSPKFNVTRTFQVPQELLGKDELRNQELSITIDVNKGMVEDVMLMVPPGLKAANGFSGQAQVVTSLKGQRFSEEAVTMLQKALSELESPEQTRNEFVVDCLRQVVTSV